MSSERVTRLEELMNAHQAKYEGALNRFSTDMAKNDNAFDRFRADMAKNDSALDRLGANLAQLYADLEKRDAETARRQSKYLQWLIGTWIAGVIITITALGFVIRLQT